MSARRLHSIFALTTALAFSSACSDDPGTPDAGDSSDAQIVPDAETDAGFADAAAPDAEPIPDSGPQDAGPLPDLGIVHYQSSCAPCDTQCPGGTCLTNQQQESFCADSCDSDLEGCIPGYTCLNLGQDNNPAYYCVPPGGTCIADGSGFGSPCIEDTKYCSHGLDHCQGDFHNPGYCTKS